MKSLGFMQEITVRLRFDADVNLEDAEKALFEKAYHTKSALQLACDICFAIRRDISKWLARHPVEVRREPISNSLIVTLETYDIAAERTVGFMMDVLAVLVGPARDVGPMPKEFAIRKADLYVTAIQPDWYAAILNEELEGQFQATFEPAERGKLLEFPWEQDS